MSPSSQAWTTSASTYCPAAPVAAMLPAAECPHNRRRAHRGGLRSSQSTREEGGCTGERERRRRTSTDGLPVPLQAQPPGLQCGGRRNKLGGHSSPVDDLVQPLPSTPRSAARHLTPRSGRKEGRRRMWIGGRDKGGRRKGKKRCGGRRLFRRGERRNRGCGAPAPVMLTGCGG